MKKKELLNDELKNISPFLRELKRKDDGFKLPADYFETLENSVFHKIEAGGSSQSAGMETFRGRGFMVRFPQGRLLMAIAASLSLALAAWWFFKPSAVTGSNTPTAMELTGEEVESYVLENIQEFDTEQLVTLSDDAALPVETPSQPKSNPHKTKTTSEEISPEDVEDLLKDMSDEELKQLL